MRNVTNKRALEKHKEKTLAAGIAALVIFSAVSILLPLQPAAADCVSYSESSRTIRVTCDTDFAHVASHITDETVLKPEGSGAYVLNANLQVDDGMTLTISSSDASWLKLTGSYGITVYGRIEITGVKISSWDVAAGAPVEQDSKGSVPRAFINLRGSEGGFIKDSEVAYLGYDLVGRRGIDLYGNGASHDFEIGNSKVHDNWMGFYSNGAYNIVIEGSEFYGNIRYAIDPHSGTRDMRVSNVHAHHNPGVAIICSDKCSNIIFESNIVHDNSQTGLFLSRATTDSVVRNNVIYNQLNAFAISVSESQNNLVYGNKISDSNNGITVHNPSPPRAEGVSTGNRIYDNSFENVNLAFRAQASAENTFASNTFGKVNNDHYLITQNANITIEEQEFDNTKIRGTAGNNEVTIQKSGRIEVGGTVYDTDAAPFKMILRSQTIIVNSVTDSPLPPPPAADTTPPSVAITSPAANQKFPPGNVPVSGTASDNEGGSGVKTVEVRVHKWVDGTLGDLYLGYKTATPNAPGDWSTWATELNILDEGSYRIQARATDNAGNQNWNSRIIVIDEGTGTEPEPEPEPVADTAAPSVQLTEPANNANVLLGSLSVKGTAADNEGGSGVKTVQVRVHKWVNGALGDLYLGYQTAAPAAEGDWSTWSLGIDLSETGTYRIQARATDNAGNQAWNSIIITVSETEPEPAPAPDTTIPDVRITSPSTGSTVPAGTVDLQGTAVDNDGGSGIKTVQVRVHKWVDGTLGELYLGYETATPAAEEDWSTWGKSLSIPDAGTFRIQARATDNAGNQDWHAIIVTVG